MDKQLFLEIVAEFNKDYERSLEDFSCEINGKTYAFSVDDDGWDDEGKYQYKTEIGTLIEVDKKFRQKKRFNFGLEHCIQRSGSYFSDYYYDYPDKPDAFEMVEELIPEVIIPEHYETKIQYI